MKKLLGLVCILFVLLTPRTGWSMGQAYDFEGDSVGDAPMEFALTQTVNGSVTVQRDDQWGNFARLTATSNGDTVSDTHINLNLNVTQKLLVVRCKWRTGDTNGNKKLLLRDANGVFIELAYFRDGKFGYLNKYPGGGERALQTGAVYDLEFNLDIRNKIADIRIGTEVISTGFDYGRFQFGSITFRCQNTTTDSAVSVVDIDDICLYQLDTLRQDLYASGLWYENGDDMPLSNVSLGDIQVCQKVANKGDNPKDVRHVTGIKRDDVLQTIASDIARIKPGESVEFRTQLRVPKTYLNGGELFSYLWEANTMEPLRSAFISQPGGSYWAPATEQVLEDFNRTAIARGRPWIIIDKARKDYICDTNDPDMLHWKELVTVAADSIGADLPDYVIKDNRLLAVSQQVLKRTQILALAYMVTMNDKYRDRLYDELEAAAAFPDWHPSHFLDTAEMTAAFAIGYDWLYDQWTPAQRQVLRRAIVEKGLTPGLQCYLGRLGAYGRWVGWDWNWNVVCNGGLAAGALAVMDTDPELASEIISRGLDSYQAMVGEFAPDGAWKEGPGYWAYSVQYLTIYMSALRSALGTDYGYGDAEGINRTAYYIIQMTGVDRTFNLNDSGDGKVNAPELYWLAARYSDPNISRYRLERVRSGYYNWSPMDLVWYDPANTAESVQLPLEDVFRDTEAAVFRDSWDNTRLFAGIHGGENNVTHGNLDAGSFVLDMLGQRFAMDLGGDNYELPGYFDNDGMRWQYYRNRAEGHNTIVINPGNGPDQTVDAFSEITDFSGGENPFAIVNMTPAQSESADSARRGMMLVNNRTGMVLRDEIRMKSPSEVYWFMHTQAAIEGYGADNRSVILNRGGQRIWVGILDGEGSFEVKDARPLSTSPQPTGQNANNGVRKLIIHRTGAERWDLTVAFLPLEYGASVPDSIPRVSALEQWTEKKLSED